MPWRIPDVQVCCGCVRDLRAAVAIIAVLGIVSSPAVSWAVVRHSYVIHVSCYVTTSAVRSDVIDINLHNILSFGFGANAGLGPSCLGKNITETDSKSIFRTRDDPKDSPFVTAVKYTGWIVLVADIFFIIASVHFLYKIFKGPDIAAAKYFMIACLVAIVLSFIYGMLFVTACTSIGGAFPIFELAFTIIDVLIWAYFLIVVYSYRRRAMRTAGVSPTS